MSDDTTAAPTPEPGAATMERLSTIVPGGAGMELNPDEMQAVTKRLRRAQGQIGGILKMIEEGRDCQDIVTQLAAVSKALDRAGFAVIALGLRQCIVSPESQTMDVESMEKLFLSLA
jgi:DNA-binding FrmR family transcriptional regulator